MKDLNEFTTTRLSGQQLLDADQALDKVLSSIHDEQVRQELMAWFQYGSENRKKQLAALSAEQLGLLLEKIPDLLLILYCIAKS